MKCIACGAINSHVKTKCDFCGSAAVADPEKSGSEDITNVVKPQITNVQDTLNLVTELNNTPSTGFNIWAFLFPIAFLWGYGATDNAKKVALTSIIPTILVSIVGYLSLKLAGAMNAIAVLWIFFVSYLVSTRTHVLMNKGASYNMGAGIVAQIAYIIIFFLIEYFL